MTDWQSEQIIESEWWGNCTNTFGEETKQTIYAELMGLNLTNRGGPGPFIVMGDKSILDIGGGPCSLLLKTNTTGEKTLIEPGRYPEWVLDRYTEAEVSWHNLKGENFADLFENMVWDECWIYNVLQHTENPAEVVRNALAKANLIRIFEWIDIPPHPGHPHTLTEAGLNEWLDQESHPRGSRGRTYELNTSGCVGRAYVGIFST